VVPAAAVNSPWGVRRSTTAPGTRSSSIRRSTRAWSATGSIGFSADGVSIGVLVVVVGVVVVGLAPTPLALAAPTKAATTATAAIAVHGRRRPPTVRVSGLVLVLALMVSLPLWWSGRVRHPRSA
jgi:hypothetical protein